MKRLRRWLYRRWHRWRLGRKPRVVGTARVALPGLERRIKAARGIIERKTR